MGIIYKYTAPNGKSYIGQTKYNRAMRGTKPDDYISCTAFHAALIKYGMENFTYTILEKCDNELLDEKEMYYIQLYNSKIPNGYNIKDGGNNTRSWSKQVYQFKQDGTLVKVYDSLTEAALENNCSVASLSEVCTGRKYTCLGYVWTYDNIYIPPKNKKNLRNKIVYQFNEDGQLIREFESVKNAANFNKVPLAQIYACANKNKRKRVGDCIFTYEPDIDWQYYSLKHKRNSTTISEESREKLPEVLCSTDVDEDIV